MKMKFNEAFLEELHRSHIHVEPQHLGRSAEAARQLGRLIFHSWREESGRVARQKIEKYCCKLIALESCDQESVLEAVHDTELKILRSIVTHTELTGDKITNAIEVALGLKSSIFSSIQDRVTELMGVCSSLKVV